MANRVRICLLGAAAVLSAACAERVTRALDASSILDPAFVTLPTGFESTTSSFDTGASGMPFAPGGNGEHHHHGSNGLMDGHDFMGGGLRVDFLGGPLAGGRPFDHDADDALSDGCSFAAGVVTCSRTHDGLTVTRTMTITSVSGVAQANPDSTTNAIVTHSTVAGTTTRRSGFTTTVSHTSDRTLAGLAATSTQRTVDGTSAGTETTTGTDSVGAFTATRVVGDTVTGVVIPVAAGRPSYPIAGHVIRSMTATVTYAGAAAVTSTRREVLSYDGSATASLVITRDGTTKTCSVPLPHGRPVCP